MQQMTPFRLSSRVWQGLLLGVLCALLMRGAVALGWFRSFENNTQDTMFRWRGLRSPDPNIVLVVADDQTVAHAAAWPLPRRLYAHVITRLKTVGAKTIGLDVLLTTPSFHRQDDRDLVQASREAGNVVQSAAFFVPTSQNPVVPVGASANDFQIPERFQTTDRNARCRSAAWVSSAFVALSETAPALGHINVHPEMDGTLRRISHVIRYRDATYPSLALASAAHFLGKTPNDIVAVSDKVLLAGRELPIDTEGETTINWAGGNNTFPTYSFDDVLSGRVGAETFKGRVVLVGVTATGAFEHRATPFSPLQPAIEMQASALNDILQNRPLLMPPSWLPEAMLLLCCMLAGVLVAPRRALAGSLVLAGFSVALWLAAIWIMGRYDFYLPVGVPIISGLFTYGVLTAFNYRRAWEENWRADTAVATLARGGALLASGRDRASLEHVILETARDALHAQEVLFIAPNDSDETRHQLVEHIGDEGSAILWPAEAKDNASSTDPQPGSLLQRVRFVKRSPRERSQSTSATSLSQHLETLWNSLGEQRPKELSALGQTLVAAPLVRPVVLPGENATVSHGVLVAVGRVDGGVFTPRDAILLETLAEQAAMAMENLDYYEQLSGRIESANQELKDAYSLLSEQSVKLSAAVESIDDAVIVTNERGEAIHVNAAAREILRDATPALNQSVPDMLREHNLEELATSFDVLPSVARRTLIMDLRDPRAYAMKVQKEIVRQQVIMHDESTLDGENGHPPNEAPEVSTRIWATQFVPLLGEGGRMLGALLVVSDVTAQRELDKMKTDFVGYVAHELRTPLTTILGYSSLLQGAGDKIPDEQKSGMIGSIIQHCRRLNRMISELLDVSRLEAGHELALRREPLDFAAMSERVLHEHQSALSRHDLNFEFHAATRPIMAVLDADRMEQVLNNLVSNAAKYSPDGGTVTVEVEDAGEDVLLRVRDTGMGMTPDQQHNLFQKFYRTQDAQSRGIKGTGLGLFLVKQLVESHGGLIGVESEAGQGTTFTVSLPKKLPALEENGITMGTLSIR
jgi:signal transduction histidine kinase/CHASE2 domain-containing sensor protein